MVVRTVEQAIDVLEVFVFSPGNAAVINRIDNNPSLGRVLADLSNCRMTGPLRDLYYGTKATEALCVLADFIHHRPAGRL